MNSNVKKFETTQILWSMVFAFAIVATALVFKGPAGYWIEAALMVGALTFVVLKSQKPAPCTVK